MACRCSRRRKPCRFSKVQAIDGGSAGLLGPGPAGGRVNRAPHLARPDGKYVHDRCCSVVVAKHSVIATKRVSAANGRLHSSGVASSWWRPRPRSPHPRVRRGAAPTPPLLRGAGEPMTIWSMLQRQCQPNHAEFPLVLINPFNECRWRRQLRAL
jgi:hypothetical protein